MEKKTKKVVKPKKKEQKPTHTCVCNMEWRTSNDDGWEDCICYIDE